MPNDESYSPSVATFKGETILDPEYSEEKLDKYKGNPFVEAIGPIPSLYEITKSWNLPDAPSEEIRNLEPQVKMDAVKDLATMFLPVNNFPKIFLKIIGMVREGYQARNPMIKDFVQRGDFIRKEPGENIYPFHLIQEYNKFRCSSVKASSVIGVSGMGKTTAVDLSLFMLPQKIIHASYQGKPFTKQQVVWLKVDCPHNGSIKNFCQQIFLALDDVLTDEEGNSPGYYKKHGHDRNTAATMTDRLKIVTHNHGLGIIVIDEIQHLLNSKNHDIEILNYLTHLSNRVGVPILLVGTPKALGVLQKDLTIARRFFGAGAVLWDRMKEDEEWEPFIKMLWKYQWVKNPSPLTKELSKVMYYECQGITSIAVNLFRLAQERAFWTTEKLTAREIKAVANNELGFLKGMMDAYRSGDETQVAAFGDMDLSFVGGIQYGKPITKNQEARIAAMLKESETVTKAKKETLLASLTVSGIVSSLGARRVSDIIEKTVASLEKGWFEDAMRLSSEVYKAVLDEREAKKKEKEFKKSVASSGTIPDKGDLRYLLEQAQVHQDSGYQALSEAGYIKSPMEFLDMEQHFLKVGNDGF